MLELKDRLGTAIVLITHDLGVVAETAQRVIVMYAGRTVEEAPVAELLRNPKHPYTRGLIGSIRAGVAEGSAAVPVRVCRKSLAPVPSLREEIPVGIVPRCAAIDRCTRERPPLHTLTAWPSRRLLGGRSCRGHTCGRCHELRRHAVREAAGCRFRGSGAPGP